MPLGIIILITAVLAGGLGLLIGWLMGRNRASIAPADLRLENELRQILVQREAELMVKRDQLTQMMTSLANDLANQSAAERGIEVSKKITSFWRTMKTTGEINSPNALFSGEVQAIAKRSRSGEHPMADPEEHSLIAGGVTKTFCET
jgi:hypothetical protein